MLTLLSELKFLTLREDQTHKEDTDYGSFK